MNKEQDLEQKKETIKKRKKGLLINIGNSFKHLRKLAGYGNSTAFAIDRGIPEGSYGKHEAGIENMTIESLVSYMVAHGLKNEDVFNKQFLQLGHSKDSEELKIKISNTFAHQVRLQLKIYTKDPKEQYLDDKDCADIRKILITGKKEASKTNLFKSINLKSKTTRFEHLISILIQAGMLTMTFPKNPNHPQQKYYTTELGKNLLQLSLESE